MLVDGERVEVGDTIAFFDESTGFAVADSIRTVTSVNYLMRTVHLDSGVPGDLTGKVAKTNYAALTGYFLGKAISSSSGEYSGITMRYFDQELVGFLRGRAPSEQYI
jgi:hypothetical protein